MQYSCTNERAAVAITGVPCRGWSQMLDVKVQEAMQSSFSALVGPQSPVMVGQGLSGAAGGSSNLWLLWGRPGNGRMASQRPGARASCTCHTSAHRSAETLLTGQFDAVKTRQANNPGPIGMRTLSKCKSQTQLQQWRQLAKSCACKPSQMCHTCCWQSGTDCMELQV